MDLNKAKKLLATAFELERDVKVYGFGRSQEHLMHTTALL
jgi:hypothetical protein